MDRPRRSEGYRVEALDDEILLYHPGQTRVIALNPTAALLWNLCDGSRTTGEIVAALREAYPEAAAEIPGDVEELIATFKEHGAIEFA
jgi:hypothetical protein